MIKKEVVEAFISHGLNVVGVNSNKLPTERWGKYQKELHKVEALNSSSIAVVCGKVSGNLEIIDIDTKYDLTGELYGQYMDKIKAHDGLFDKLVIQQTFSGGYHIIYRCNDIEGNKKLANRNTTDQERKEFPNEKVKVLIETRGEGGYALIQPSKGYKIIKGKLSNIPKLTKEERDLLHAIAKEFDQEDTEPIRPPKTAFISEGLTPWDDYDNRESCLDILLRNGWTEVKGYDKKRILVKRAGDTSANHSGNILVEKNLFKSFSTSTEFEAEKAYSPSGVFCILECEGDWSLAGKTLYKLGYGDRRKETDVVEYAKERLKKSDKPKNVGDIESYLVNSEQDSEFLDKYRSGGVNMGRTTGNGGLDEYFVFKDGKFVVVIGHSTVGKTTSTAHVLQLDALLHQRRGIMYVSENSSGEIKLQLMQWLIGVPVSAMNDQQYKFAKEWVNDMFVFIKARGGKVTDPEHFLELLYKMSVEYKDFSWIMADTYTAFIRNKRAFENDHSYDDRIATEFLNFTEATGKSLYLTQHTNTEARRKKDKDGFIARPYMDDAVGGGKWANRADTAIIFHRAVNAPAPTRYETQFHIDKERNKLYGGDVTDIENPIIMYYKDNANFIIDGENTMRTYGDRLLKANNIPTISVSNQTSEAASRLQGWERDIPVVQDSSEPPF